MLTTVECGGYIDMEFEEFEVVAVLPIIGRQLTREVVPSGARVCLLCNTACGNRFLTGRHVTA